MSNNKQAKNYRAELVCLFGDPVDDNPTGVMMEAGFRACGLNYRYMTCKVKRENLGDAIKAARALNLRGIGFTMPHKIDAVKYMDSLSQAAGIIGAINICVFQDGKLIGDNTDGKGFVLALKDRGLSPEGKKIFIIGAGGAAKAIAVECALAGAREMVIANRTAAKGEELADVICSRTPCKATAVRLENRHIIPKDTDMLINATSIGLAPDSDKRPDIDYASIRSEMVVCDVVFCPAETQFLKAAAEHGAITVNGLGMLVSQGLFGFELWTGVKAPQKKMAEALTQELE